MIKSIGVRTAGRKGRSSRGSTWTNPPSPCYVTLTSILYRAETDGSDATLKQCTIDVSFTLRL